MGTTVVVEQRVDAEPAAVYDAWSSADALARWWWPHIPDTTYGIDFRVAGRYEVRSQGAGIGVAGQFTTLDAPRELAMTWRWMDDGVPQREEPVSVRFRVVPGGTLVRVDHEIAEGTDADGIRQGWESVLGRLAGTFASGG